MFKLITKNATLQACTDLERTDPSSGGSIHAIFDRRISRFHDLILTERPEFTSLQDRIWARKQDVRGANALVFNKVYTWLVQLLRWSRSPKPHMLEHAGQRECKEIYKLTHIIQRTTYTDEK